MGARVVLQSMTAEPRIVGGRIGDPSRETVGQPIPVILPAADRLASLGLDLLVGEAGFHRNAPNPLVIGGA